MIIQASEADCLCLFAVLLNICVLSGKIKLFLYFCLVFVMIFATLYHIKTHNIGESIYHKIYIFLGVATVLKIYTNSDLIFELF